MGEALKFLIELDDKFSSPANKVLSKVGELAETLGEIGGLLGPLIKVEAALVGIGATAIVGGAALAIHASEAKQDTLDMLDAMLGSQEAAVDTYAKIEGLGGELAISLSRGSDLARQLSAAGVTNKDQLISAIKAIGEVESVLGGGVGGKIQNLIEKSSATGVFKVSGKALAGTGVDEGLLAQRLGVTKAQLEAGKVNAARGVAALTSLLDEKFGDVAKKQALDIGNQFIRLKDNISKLFEDVNTGPFLDALSKVVALFDDSTTTGKAMKQSVTLLFDKLFLFASKVLPYVQVGIKGMLVLMLKTYIALKPLFKRFGDGGDALEKFATVMSYAGSAAEELTEAIVFMAQPFLDLYDIVSEGLGLIVGLAAKFFDAGANIIASLVEGIFSGKGPITGALEALAKDALTRFKSVFGIASPSKVMAQMGEHMMSGLEFGIAANDNGPKGALTGAVDAMAPPTSAGRDSVATLASGGVGGSTSVTMSPGAIVIQINGSTAQEISSQLKQVLPGELAAAFESLGLSVGAA